MSPMPDIPESDRKKPLCYDPLRDRFIYLDDLKERREKVVPLDRLTHDQLKKLIAERHRAGPDYRVASISGQPLTRDQVVRGIEEETDFGKLTVKAEATHLSELLKRIEEALKQ